jgi:hypothetical protein
VILSDHGFYFSEKIDGKIGKDGVINSNFLAVYDSEEKHGKDLEKISSVNLFPILLNRFMAKKIEIKPNRCFVRKKDFTFKEVKNIYVD